MSQVPNGSDLSYDAFISYKRAPLDTAVAERLMTLLEGYRAPATLIKAHRGEVRQRIRRVFRDREELHACPDLQKSLEEALANSRFLVVVCSPGAARSPWVCREIELFRRLRGPQFILPLLIDGEPSADLDDPRAAFPPPLVQQETEQANADAAMLPLAADIRDGSSVSQRKVLAALRGEVLRLLAPMLGCAYDELVRRHHQRLVKRTLTAAGGLAGVLLVITALAIIGFLAERQAGRATEDMLGAQKALLSMLKPEADVNGRWTIAHNIEREMQDFHPVSAVQEEMRQEILIFAYRMQMMLAEKANKPQYSDEALEKALKQKIPLAIARLHAFHPTLSSYLADLWMAIRTRPALWVAEQKPLDLRYQSDEIWDRQRQLSAYDRLTHVTAESAARYTDDIAELLREVDLSVAEDRNKAHQLLQRCRETWTLAAQKQALTPQEQELVYEVNQALRRLGDD